MLLALEVRDGLAGSHRVVGRPDEAGPLLEGAQRERTRHGRTGAEAVAEALEGVGQVSLIGDHGLHALDRDLTAGSSADGELRRLPPVGAVVLAIDVLDLQAGLGGASEGRTDHDHVSASADELDHLTRLLDAAVGDDHRHAVVDLHELLAVLVEPGSRERRVGPLPATVAGLAAGRADRTGADAQLDAVDTEASILQGHRGAAGVADAEPHVVAIVAHDVVDESVHLVGSHLERIDAEQLAALGDDLVRPLDVDGDGNHGGDAALFELVHDRDLSLQAELVLGALGQTELILVDVHAVQHRDATQLGEASEEVAVAEAAHGGVHDGPLEGDVLAAHGERHAHVVELGAAADHLLGRVLIDHEHVTVVERVRVAVHRQITGRHPVLVANLRQGHHVSLHCLISPPAAYM